MYEFYLFCGTNILLSSGRLLLSLAISAAWARRGGGGGGGRVHHGANASPAGRSVARDLSGLWAFKVANYGKQLGGGIQTSYSRAKQGNGNPTIVEKFL